MKDFPYEFAIWAIAAIVAIVFSNKNGKKQNRPVQPVWFST